MNSDDSNLSQETVGITTALLQCPGPHLERHKSWGDASAGVWHHRESPSLCSPGLGWSTPRMLTRASAHCFSMWPGFYTVQCSHACTAQFFIMVQFSKLRCFCEPGKSWINFYDSASEVTGSFPLYCVGWRSHNLPWFKGTETPCLDEETSSSHLKKYGVWRLSILGKIKKQAQNKYFEEAKNRVFSQKDE